MKVFKDITDKLSYATLTVAGIALIASMLLVVYNAIIRNFTDPIAGTPEIAGLLGMIAITFSLAYTQKEKGNVGINILTEKLGKTAQNVIYLIVSLLSLAFFTLVSVKLVDYGLDLIQHKVYLQTTGFAVYPFVLIMAVGFFGLVIQLLYQVTEAISMFSNKEEKGGGVK